MSNRRERYIKARLRQIILGIVLLMCAIIVLIVASNAKENISRDATAVVILIPAGLALIFTKHIYIN